MTAVYEYKVIPAPARGVKARGVKTPEARFALAVETLMNEMAGEGWEFLRSETLPSQERAGLTSTATQWRTMLVFRRPRESSDTTTEAFLPRVLPPKASEATAAPAFTLGMARPAGGSAEPPLTAAQALGHRQAEPPGPDAGSGEGPQSAAGEDDAGTRRT
ncbi:MAG: DUF4177 domain-containing protein [Paracoccaceae bacterium]